MWTPVASSHQRTWTNGLRFYLWASAYLRSHRVTTKTIFTVDHGQAFGGQSWFHLRELPNLIAAFGSTLIQKYRGYPLTYSPIDLTMEHKGTIHGITISYGRKKSHAIREPHLREKGSHCDGHSQ